jgi:NADPH:quinone reductase
MSAPLIIPHSDGAGDIDEVGAGVSGRKGERVWIWNGQWKRAYGTAAEYIVVPGAQAVRLPDKVGYEVGACLGIPALTAIQAVRLAQIGSETTVLIAGGAGSVAHYAIQLAKLRGARVITTISNDVKATHARAAGADQTINYRTEDVGEREGAHRRTRGRCADRNGSQCQCQTLSGGPTASLHGRRVRLFSAQSISDGKPHCRPDRQDGRQKSYCQGYAQSERNS